MLNNGYTPKVPTGPYDLATGAAICTLIESVCVKHGFHVALTGGCLYGEGGRKDVDLIFYRIRQVKQQDIKMDAFWVDMKNALDIWLIEDHGFVKKAEMGTGTDKIPLDCMFPEDVYGDYPVDCIAAGDWFSPPINS